MSSATAARSARTKAERRRPNKGSKGAGPDRKDAAGNKGARSKTAADKDSPAVAAHEDAVATKARAGKAADAKASKAKGSTAKPGKEQKAPALSKVPSVVTAVDPNSTGPSRQPKLKAGPPPLDLEIDPDVLEFIRAIDDYRIANDRPFPSWSEVLHVVKQLGYRRR